MNSLKFRGRVAAVIVAILLMTTIFLAVPASASESCNHEYTGDYVYWDNGDGATHSLSFYCPWCFSAVELSPYESHELDDGRCVYCGYIMPPCESHEFDGDTCIHCGYMCQHTNTSEPVYSSDNFIIGGRWIHYTSYECLDCGEVFNLEGQDCYTNGDTKYTAHSDSLTMSTR